MDCINYGTEYIRAAFACTFQGRFQQCAKLCLHVQVKVWFQNRRMKWRHSKEAQAQKDKEKEQADKSATEAEQKTHEDSEGESEPSESELEDEAEDKRDGTVSELSKSSVIIAGPLPDETAATNSAATDSPAPAQMLL